MDKQTESKSQAPEVRRERIREMVSLQEAADAAAVLSAATPVIKDGVSALKSRREKRKAEETAEPKIVLPPGADRH